MFGLQRSFFGGLQFRLGLFSFVLGLSDCGFHGGHGFGRLVRRLVRETKFGLGIRPGQFRLFQFLFGIFEGFGGRLQFLIRFFLFSHGVQLVKGRLGVGGGF